MTHYGQAGLSSERISYWVKYLWPNTFISGVTTNHFSIPQVFKGKKTLNWSSRCLDLVRPPTCSEAWRLRQASRNERDNTYIVHVAQSSDPPAKVGWIQHEFWHVGKWEVAKFGSKEAREIIVF